MKQNKSPLTTVSVDADIRDRINAEAVRLDMSQRQMVGRLLEVYDLHQKNDNASGSSPPVDMQDVYEVLEKVLKRDDRVIAFIKEQEKVLLNPILSTVQGTDARLEQLVNILSNLE